MRDGGHTGCVIRDAEIYGAEYRKARSRAIDVLKNEAARCRECDSPMCQQACPAGLDIPGFISAFRQGDLPAAYSLLAAGNLLPEMCAMICPVEVQCEGACVERILNGKPVAISHIQYEIARQARENGYAGLKIPVELSDQRIAVVGAGPAGLACAAALLQFGHVVDLFEKNSVIGGKPASVIPADKLTAENLRLEFDTLFKEAMEKKRLTLHLGDSLNKFSNLDHLKHRFRFVFLGFGLSESIQLPRTVFRPAGVEDALGFLKRIKSGSNLRVEKTVVVIGGGNSAFDSALAAQKCGADDVYVVYRRSFQEMPAWPEQKQDALARGIHILVLMQPIDYIEKDGRLTGVRMARTELEGTDPAGRRRFKLISGSEFVFPAKQAIEALGQKIAPDVIEALGGIPLTADGRIQVDARFRVLDNVYAGGDIIHETHTAVQAVADGLRAAAIINERISKRS